MQINICDKCTKRGKIDSYCLIHGQSWRHPVGSGFYCDTEQYDLCDSCSKELEKIHADAKAAFLPVLLKWIGNKKNDLKKKFDEIGN